MDTTILIGLRGHPEPFRLDQDAYVQVTRYLDRAAARLQADPDVAEVLGDLERSIGDRLLALGGPAGGVVTAADIRRVLEAVGSVDTGETQASDAWRAPGPKRKRRFRRVREGQEIAGVCTGLAAYSELDVDWVRTIFILGALVTGGILGVVYILLALFLPIDATREG
jgi:phage shock protein PspC (stress-responsive transcriptional regulator)